MVFPNSSDALRPFSRYPRTRCNSYFFAQNWKVSDPLNECRVTSYPLLFTYRCAGVVVAICCLTSNFMHPLLFWRATRNPIPVPARAGQPPKDWLEGDVFVVYRVVARRGRRLLFPAAQQSDLPPLHFQARALVAVAVGILPNVEFTLHGHLLPLGQILRQGLGLFAPKCYPHPNRLGFLSVFLLAIHGQAEA